MREPGFYWVCIDKREGANEWIIALWSGEYWHFHDQLPARILDDSIPEIDERRIVRDENKLVNHRDKEIERRCNAIIDLLKHS